MVHEHANYSIIESISINYWFELPLMLSSKMHSDEAYYQNSMLCRVPSALGKALKTLDKGFIKCHRRHVPLGLAKSLPSVFY